MRLRKVSPATIVATLALFFALGGTASTAHPVAIAACTRDVPAIIGGKHKCLGAGEYCATRYERQYERYGLCAAPAIPRRGLDENKLVQHRPDSTREAWNAGNGTLIALFRRAR